jgi:hypothetical protein
LLEPVFDRDFAQELQVSVETGEYSSSKGGDATAIGEGAATQA